MNEQTTLDLKPYAQWRSGKQYRGEDAATCFGYYLIQHCRNDILQQAVKFATSPDEVARTIHTVDSVLFNVIDLLEGAWMLPIDKEHQIELALHVLVRALPNHTSTTEAVIEDIPISPCELDLPIGFHKWLDDFNKTTDLPPFGGLLFKGA